MHKSELKAEEYRARAREASEAAQATPLERVRAQRQQSADTWAGLAEAEEARIHDRRLREAGQ